MQFLSRLTDTPSFQSEQSAGTFLPYARLMSDDVVLLRDGTLMQTIKLGGFLFETAESDELNYRKALRDAMLRAVGSSRFAIYHNIIRRQISTDASDEFPDNFSTYVNRVWNDRLHARRLFHNELYLSIIRRPPQRQGGLIAQFAEFLGKSRSASEMEARLASEIRALNAATQQLVSALAAYGPQVLGTYERNGVPHSEILEFLGTLYNGQNRPLQVPHSDVGEFLPARRVSFGHDMLELGPMGRDAPAFGAILSVKDYPGHSTPGMLDDILRLPIEMVVSQSFAFVDRGESLSRMNLALRRMRAADDEAVSLRDDLSRAKDDVAASRAVYGEHHLSILVRGASPDAVNLDIAEVQSALAALGIVAVREDFGLEPAFWAQFPGNFRFIARRALLGTANFASFASYHNFPLGRADGNHWGASVCLFETTAAGPYHFNFHHGDLGNFTIIGPSGSGKTVMVNFLLAQARRFHPRIVFFDKDRGAELFIRAIGGTYDVLRPGVASALNPLLLPPSPENAAFLSNWIVQLAGGPDTVDARDLALVKEAVEANFSAPPEYRTLTAFVELLRGSSRPTTDDLYARLRPWWGDGEHAWLFDNPADLIDVDAQTIGFDMTKLLDHPQLRTPAMMYLFHRVEERLDGSPAIIVIDEGWKALDDDIFVVRIRDWEKTIRKRNGIVGFVTQNAGDALESRISGAIVEQSATNIFAANPKALAEHYMDGFKLSQHEYDLVRSLPDNARCFLVKHGGESVVVRLNLAGEGDLLTIFSGREKTIRLFDEIRSRTGDNPANWLPELLKVA